MKPREPRTTVVLPARIRWEGRWIAATVRNLSPHGLMLHAAMLPPLGTYVEIQLFSHVITARAVRHDAQLCSFETRETLDVARLTAPGGAAVASAVVSPDFGKRPARAKASAKAQGERSRALGRAMQYATMVAVSVTAAGSLGWEVYHTLQAPFAAVSSKLGGPA